MHALKLILISILTCGGISGAATAVLVKHVRAAAYEEGFQDGYVEGIHECEAAAFESGYCYDEEHGSLSR